MQPPPVSHDNTLGAYRLLRKLGEGGMGTVYLAWDTELERHVAIKVLRMQEGLSDRGAASQMKRLIREAQSAARLNHPNVVTIYTVGRQPGAGATPFIVMEYVEGGSLGEHLQQYGPMPWRPATEAIRDALAALAAAHDAGIIHRDLKPANLMRARDGSVKLADFGLARIMQTPMDGELTFPGAFVGSPSYASPEQASGAAKIDGRADLYSLAATWFALLSGRPPFVADDPAEVMARHIEEPFPDICERAPGVPLELIKVLDRASKKTPAERFFSANEMRAAVEKILASPVHVVPLPVDWKRPDAQPDETVAELETRLESARSSADSGTQLTTLRRLFGLYSQLDRREAAMKAFREALVVHVKMRQPPRGSSVIE